MRSVVLGLLLLTLLPACKKESPLKDVSDAKFHAGQRWNYWARPGEEQSTFTVEKVESHPTIGVIVHIGLDNLKLTKDKKTVGYLVHLPFSRDAIEKSAAKDRPIEDDAGMPPFKTSYDAWRAQVEEGKGSVIQVPIAEHLTAIEDK